MSGFCRYREALHLGGPLLCLNFFPEKWPDGVFIPAVKLPEAIVVKIKDIKFSLHIGLVDGLDLDFVSG